MRIGLSSFNLGVKGSVVVVRMRLSLSKDAEFPMKDSEGLGLLNANYK
jgi:hypothetical protein